MYRIALFRGWITLLVVGVSCALGSFQVVDAQTIDLRMGLEFNNPADDQSGGTFQLASLSSGGGGISAIEVYLKDVDLSLSSPITPEVNSPETFNWLESPVPPILDRGGGVTGIIFGQDVSLELSTVVFNIGHGAGTPGAQDVDPFGLGFDNAALIATGTFSPGTIPSFSEDPDFITAGNVFNAVDSQAAIEATVNLSVVDNFGVSPDIDGDYNSSGQVEQGDLDLVLLNWGDSATPVPTGWINDLPTPDKIDQDDLDRVLLHWGNTAAPASVTTIPEPASLWMITMGIAGCLILRSRSGIRRRDC